MTDPLKIRINCSRCRGTGLDDNGTDGQGNPTSLPCESCGQTGFLVSGSVDGAEELDWLKKKMKLVLKALDQVED